MSLPSPDPSPPVDRVQIGVRWVGRGEPCLVIAEVGSNHNRDLAQAKRLIDIAAEAGADAVKFQTFLAEKLYSKRTPTMSYLKQSKLIGPNQTVWDLLKQYELPREWHEELADDARSKGLIFLSTPFDLEAVDLLERIGVSAYKIASYEITHLPLLERVAQTGKPIILSTGMADLRDIETALERIHQQGNRQVILLHCAVNYPPKFEDVHLRAMQTLRQAFQVPVGFSDHTMGIAADIAAVALGACVIEKHFTISRSLRGPDHPFAVEPHELKAMVEGIRQTEAALGSPIKRHTPAEEEMYRLGRRSLVAACRIAKGTRVTREMVDVKRPGYGIETRLLETLLGRMAQRDIEEDEVLQWDMF